MKLKTEAFPYPVLSPKTFTDKDNKNDYLESFFKCDININKTKDGKYIKFEYDIQITNKEIKALVSNKKAKCVLQVISGHTGFRQAYTLDNLNGNFSTLISELYDRVEINPYVVIVSKVDSYTSDDLNDEFLLKNNKGELEFRKFNLKVGDMIAFDDPIIKYIDFKPIGIRSLLKVETDETLSPNLYKIDPSDNEMLTIRMGSEIRSLWNKKHIKEYLQMPVIKDCILIALDEYRMDKDGIKEKKWAKLFIDQIDNEQGLGLNTSIDELNLIAQEVSMKFTLNKIKKKDVE